METLVASGAAYAGRAKSGAGRVFALPSSPGSVAHGACLRRPSPLRECASCRPRSRRRLGRSDNAIFGGDVAAACARDLGFWALSPELDDRRRPDAIRLLARAWLYRLERPWGDRRSSTQDFSNLTLSNSGGMVAMQSNWFRAARCVVAAAVVLIAWGMVFWGLLADPLGVFHELPDADAVTSALVDAKTPTGTYFMPWPRDDAESFEQFVAQHRSGPFYRLNYLREGVDPNSPGKLLVGSLHYVTVADDRLRPRRAAGGGVGRAPICGASAGGPARHELHHARRTDLVPYAVGLHAGRCSSLRSSPGPCWRRRSCGLGRDRKRASVLLDEPPTSAASAGRPLAA